MRHHGPAKWREWRWGQTVVPLQGEAVKPIEADPSSAKPLSEIAHQTISKLTANGLQAKLTEGLSDFVTRPDSPSGRFSEQRLRDLFKETVTTNLSKEECEEIFPPPKEPEVAEEGEGSRKGSKRKSSVSRQNSKQAAE
mmetsp:Transcript_26981/g.48776  ORF Transcript_26981/g.48776 Transcript_26981/m.48776 type:complete len:139 (+) Transcript_26981:88-504(+)